MSKPLIPSSEPPGGPSFHRRQMLKLARQLSKDDIDEIVYLSEDFLSEREAEDIMERSAGTTLMRCLEKRNKIGPENYTYLTTCLQEVGRLDLVTLLTSQSVPYLPSSFSVPHQMRLRKLSTVRAKQQRYASQMQQIINLAQEHSGSEWKKIFETLTVCLEGFQSPPPTASVSSILGETLEDIHKGSAALIDAVKNLERKDYKGVKENLQATERHSRRLYKHLDAISWLKPQHLKVLENETVKLHPIVGVASEGCSSLCDVLVELLGESTVIDEQSKLQEVLLGLELVTTTCRHEFIMISWIAAMIQAASRQSDCLDLQDHASQIESTVQLLRKEGLQSRGDVVLKMLQGTNVGRNINEEMLVPQQCNNVSVSTAIVQDCPVLMTAYLSMFVLENWSKLSLHDWCQIKANIRLNEHIFATMYARTVKVVFQAITNDLDYFREEMLRSALARAPGLRELVFELFHVE